ncbi:MAG: hypothetical protein ACHQRM_12945 [Bacteroidia bacterium]
MYDSLKRFELKFAHLKKLGFRINGLVMIDPKRKSHAIDVSRPLIFDSRLIPKKFEGLPIKCKIYGELPVEFNVDREKKEYVWAPERFEKYVDRCATEIKKTLNNPAMNRNEMLSALCFGNFEEHKVKYMQLIQQGKFAAYREN